MAGHFSTSSSAYRGTETVVVVCKCLVVIVSGRGGCWWLRNKQEHRQDDVQNEERCKLPLTASLAGAVVDPLQGGGDGSVDEEVMWSDDDDDDGVVARTHCPALHWMGGWRLTSHYYCSSSECGGNKRFNKTCNKSASQHELLLVAGVVVVVFGRQLTTRRQAEAAYNK